ncbi:MAG: DedA family protein [Actinomycetes bacterium]
MHLASALISTASLDSMLVRYGYLAVFLLVGLESLGIPLPGETMLVLAAVYAGTTGRLSIAVVVLVAVVAAIVGDNVGYALGRYGGWPLLARFGHVVRVRERDLKVGRYLFAEHGGAVVFLGRFVALLRTYAAFLAGVNHMPWPRFFVANAAGAVVWATAWGTGAFVAGATIERLSTPVDVVVVGLAALAALAGAWRLHRAWSVVADRAEAAFPGPL